MRHRNTATKLALNCTPVSSPYSPTWEVCRPCSCPLTRSRPASLTQEALSGFAEAAGTAFISLVVSGRVVAATESWWRLGMPEAVLLPWLVGSLPPQAARDYPVYLPHGSPKVSEWVGRAGRTVRAGRSAPRVGPGGPPPGARACHEKRRSSGQPTRLCCRFHTGY